MSWRVDMTDDARDDASTCPICGSREAREIFRTLRHRAVQATGRHTEALFGLAGRLVRCARCSLVRQQDPISAPYGDAEDPEYLSEERGNRQTFREILATIERYRSPPGRVLDAGCGPGLLLDEARARGWDTVGVEPSAWAVGVARERGLDVHEGTLESVDLPSATFDAVVAADVIEHVPDPVAFARRMSELLVPGGVAFIATPNVESLFAQVLRRWWWSVIPNHLWLFSPGTLHNVLRQANLEPIRTTTHAKTFSVEYYAGRFGGYSSALGSVTRAVGRAFGGRDRLIRPDLHDRMAVVARRP